MRQIKLLTNASILGTSRATGDVIAVVEAKERRTPAGAAAIEQGAIREQVAKTLVVLKRAEFVTKAKPAAKK